MAKLIDPQKYGLHTRTLIEEIDQQTIALVMHRKSRIIMSDGRKILEKILKMKSYDPDKLFVLKTSAPVCSKTQTYLEKEGVEVLSIAL